MTPIMLQKALKEELEQLFEGFLSSEKMDHSERAVTVYEQLLPEDIATVAEEGKIPFVIVRLSEGEMEQPEDAERVKVIFIFCSQASEWNKSGYADVANMIQRVKERFLKNPVIGDYFTAELPMKWVLQEDDTTDLYYGGVEMDFACPGIRRESRFA